jgi:hypothetical protein
MHTPTLVPMALVAIALGTALGSTQALACDCIGRAYSYYYASPAYGYRPSYGYAPQAYYAPPAYGYAPRIYGYAPRAYGNPPQVLGTYAPQAHGYAVVPEYGYRPPAGRGKKG